MHNDVFHVVVIFAGFCSDTIVHTHLMCIVQGFCGYLIIIIIFMLLLPPLLLLLLVLLLFALRSRSRIVSQDSGQDGGPGPSFTFGTGSAPAEHSPCANTQTEKNKCEHQFAKSVVVEHAARRN